MLLSALAVGACAGEGFDVSLPSQIALIADTDRQQVPAGGRIPNALAVMVTADDGTPAPRAEVGWTVVEGTGASLSDPLTLADGMGRAEVSLTLGPVPGMYVSGWIKRGPTGVGCRSCGLLWGQSLVRGCSSPQRERRPRS